MTCILPVTFTYSKATLVENGFALNVHGSLNHVFIFLSLYCQVELTGLWRNAKVIFVEKNQRK